MDEKKFQALNAIDQWAEKEHPKQSPPEKSNTK